MNKESDSDGSFTSPPANKERRLQRFRTAWLKDPQFQSWLEETENPLQAKCRVCVKYLRTFISVLKEHAKSMIHRTNMQRNAGVLISVPSVATTADTNVDGPSSATITCSTAESGSSSEHIFATASIDTSVLGPSSAAIIFSNAESESKIGMVKEETLW